MVASAPSATPVDKGLAALALHSERVAFHDADGQLTYGQARDQVYRLARALLARGLRSGQVVAYVTPISTQSLLLAYAIGHLGCGRLEVSTLLPVDVQAEVIRETGTAAVVIDPVVRGTELANLLPVTPSPQVFSLGPGEIGEDLLALAKSESPLPFESPAQPDAFGTFALTGGTTGRPKIVVRRFDAPTQRSQGLPTLPRSDWPVRLLRCNRSSHLARRHVEDALVAGGTVLTRKDFDPAAVIAAIEIHRVTHLFAPPHQLRALVDHPLLASTDTSSLRWVLCTTAKASAGLLRRAVQRLGPVVYQRYGQTETAGISELSPEHYFPGREELLATCGRAQPGVEIAVRDSTGHALGVGQRGELWIRTPYVMAGYFNDPDLTAHTLQDSWLRTGDVGSLDKDGFLTLLGRATDVLDIAGHQVFFSEIENCVEDYPGVLDCAAFTIARPNTTPTLHVAVVGENTTRIDDTQLRDRVRFQLGPVGVPQSVMIVPRIPLAHGFIPDRPLLARWWSSSHHAGLPDTGG